MAARGPGKKTLAVREVLNEAFEELGGTRAFIAFGKKNPKWFYELWSKQMPSQMKITDGDGKSLMQPLADVLTKALDNA